MQQKIYNGYVWHSQVAQDLGPGHTVVTCLCDNGQVRMQKYYHSCRYVLMMYVCVECCGGETEQAMQSSTVCDYHRVCMLLERLVTS